MVFRKHQQSWNMLESSKIKWSNFTLYSNVDLPGIKRIPGKYGYRGKNHNDEIYRKRHKNCTENKNEA